jgi:hypothetical protein
LEALRRQLEKCKEDLKQCEAEKQALEAQIKELKRREQELLKARLCSLLAEIRINKLVETKPDNPDEYVDNNTVVSDEVKRRLKLPEGISGVGDLSYGNLIIMLVTACLLAGVIKLRDAIEILRSEGLDINEPIAENLGNAITYLNSLNVRHNDDREFNQSDGNEEVNTYNAFIRVVDGQRERAARREQVVARGEERAAREEAELAELEASVNADPVVEPAAAAEAAVEQDPAAPSPAAAPAVEAADTPAAAGGEPSPAPSPVNP